LKAVVEFAFAFAFVFGSVRFDIGPLSHCVRTEAAVGVRERRGFPHTARVFALIGYWGDDAVWMPPYPYVLPRRSAR